MLKLLGVADLDMLMDMTCHSPAVTTIDGRCHLNFGLMLQRYIQVFYCTNIFEATRYLYLVR
jgi:hypothetical protein